MVGDGIGLGQAAQQFAVDGRTQLITLAERGILAGCSPPHTLARRARTASPLSYFAEDAKGNREERVRLATVAVDNTAPSPLLHIAPGLVDAFGNLVPSTASVFLNSAHDPVSVVQLPGFQELRLRTNGLEQVIPSSASTFNLAEGRHDLGFWALDRVGNENRCLPPHQWWMSRRPRFQDSG